MTSVPSVPPQAGVLPGAALDGVRSRRIVAWMIDFVIICALMWLFGLIMVVLSLPTFGVSFALAPLIAFVGVFYSGLTVSGRGRGTWGMRALDLQVTARDGSRVDFIVAAGHALLFYLLTPFFTLLSLFNAEKRTLHDFLTGVIVTRRPPG
ncbi:MAG TPA: RDD family protein [Beijerinckiaceae bacterium]|nr:RDD family protein [Beijerinckiaceae bacterium]